MFCRILNSCTLSTSCTFRDEKTMHAAPECMSSSLSESITRRRFDALLLLLLPVLEDLFPICLSTSSLCGGVCNSRSHTCTYAYIGARKQLHSYSHTRCNQTLIYAQAFTHTAATSGYAQCECLCINKRLITAMHVHICNMRYEPPMQCIQRLGRHHVLQQVVPDLHADNRKSSAVISRQLDRHASEVFRQTGAK